MIVSVKMIPQLIKVPIRAPFFILSYSCETLFCQTKVVNAIAKLKTGKIANPSILVYEPVPAIA